MNRGKKILCVVLALLLFAVMALGSGSSSNEDTKPINNASGDNGTSNGEGETPIGTDSKDTPVDAAITIEEQVLLERDGIKITATEYVDDTFWGEGIKVLVENSSEKNITVGCNALIVNNYMITDLFAASVAAGKKANETIYLSSSSLEAAGIENVGQVELYFHAYDSDSYDDIFDADVVTIQTSAYATMDTTASTDGTVLYEGNGIKVVGKYVDEDSFWGSGVLLYLENTTDENIVVSCENMSINGFMITPLFYGDVYAGKMAVDEITIFSSDLEENNITSIEEIELAFHIYNSDTYNTIVETDPISFTVG